MAESRSKLIDSLGATNTNKICRQVWQEITVVFGGLCMGNVVAIDCWAIEDCLHVLNPESAAALGRCGFVRSSLYRVHFYPLFFSLLAAMLGSLQGLSNAQQQQSQQQGQQGQQPGLPPPPPPQNGQDYTLSSVLHFLQTEWRRYERDRNEWEIARAEMRVRFP